jgi:uncharacterized membrane protein
MAFYLICLSYLFSRLTCVFVTFLNVWYRLSIAAGRGFIARQAPEGKLIEKIGLKITTKSQIKFRLLEPLLIASCSGK